MTETERKTREVLGSLLAAVNFTPIQRKLMFALADGGVHSVKELIPLVDSQADKQDVAYHICCIRNKLPPHHDIVCVFNKRRINYQYVILLSSLSKS